MDNQVTDKDVVRLIIRQIGELRVPVSEEALWAGLHTIAKNLSALLEAMEDRDAAAAEAGGPDGENAPAGMAIDRADDPEPEGKNAPAGMAIDRADDPEPEGWPGSLDA